MERLVVNFKSKKNYRLIKQLVVSLGEEVEDKNELLEQLRKNRKGSFASKEEFLAMGGIAKGQLISKEHLRNLSWKKRA